MRPDLLQVVLCPRAPWEAVELGTALVRRHAGTVWRVWLLFSVPVFVLLNALLWWCDQLWLAGVLMWWLLPLFDCALLHVLARAVFGQVPGVWETLAALPAVGRGQRAVHLIWRRFSPWRTLGLPVDLLEGGNAAARRARRGLLVQGQGVIHALLAWLCFGFALLLALAALLLVLLFIPGELVPDSARALSAVLVSDPPRWAQVALNAALWLGFSLIEPFHIGAGFGLYLNRRVDLDGWDIELTLRSLHTRLHRADSSGGNGPRALLLAVCLPLLALAYPVAAAVQGGNEVHAVEVKTRSAPPVPQQTLDEVFADTQVADVGAFIGAVDAAGRDRLLRQYRIEHVWIPRLRGGEDVPNLLAGTLFPALARSLAWIGELLLWLLAALLMLVLIFTAPRWWPWMHGRARRSAAFAQEVMSPAVIPNAVRPPARIAADARMLWQAGNGRQALALLYRGSVAALAARLDVRLISGATETECLRLSQRLPDADTRAAFVHLVRVWQHAAYAGQWPADAEFDALTGMLARRFGWSL